MTRSHEKTSKSSLQLATASSTSSPNNAADDTHNASNVPATSVLENQQLRRLDNKKQQRTRKGGAEKSFPESLENHKTSNQVGAFSITTRSNHDGAPHNDVEGVNNDEIQFSHNGAAGRIESFGDIAAVEAHVVDEPSTSLFEQDKEQYEQETRQKLLAELAVQATQAEVVTIDEDRKDQGRKFLLIGCFCIVIVLIVAITAGTVLSRKTSSMTLAPSTLESSSTTGSSLTTESSSSTPEPSHQPSLIPSVPQNNTYCTEAHQLVIGQNISGSLEDSIGTTVVFCEYSSIASYAIWAPGRWYVYHGEGFPVVVRTDTFVDIHVYLVCDGGCYEDAYYPNWQYESTVLWKADLGTDYMVLVSVPEDMIEETGNKDFVLRVETNDSLENAFGPLTPGPDTVVGGSTVGAKVASNVPACGSASVPSGPGVWYSIIGNNKTITASTCGSTTGLDTQITVLSAENVCVDGNDDFCSGKSRVAWSSNADEMYFVHVHAKNGAEGTFLLQVTTEGESLAEADVCANAKLLDIGSTIPINLLQATMDPDLTNCTQASWLGVPTSPVGNFYKFIGTGQPALVVTNMTSQFPYWTLTISAVVLEGDSCATLECIHTNCDEECLVSTTLGQDYYVYTYYIEDSILPSDRDWLNGGVTLTIDASA